MTTKMFHVEQSELAKVLHKISLSGLPGVNLNQISSDSCGLCDETARIIRSRFGVDEIDDDTYMRLFHKIFTGTSIPRGGECVLCRERTRKFKQEYAIYPRVTERSEHDDLMRKVGIMPEPGVPESPQDALSVDWALAIDEGRYADAKAVWRRMSDLADRLERDDRLGEVERQIREETAEMTLKQLWGALEVCVRGQQSRFEMSWRKLRTIYQDLITERINTEFATLLKDKDITISIGWTEERAVD